MSLTPVVERLAAELSLRTGFNDLGMSQPGIEHQSPAYEANPVRSENVEAKSYV